MDYVYKIVLHFAFSVLITNALNANKIILYKMDSVSQIVLLISIKIKIHAQTLNNKQYLVLNTWECIFIPSLTFMKTNRVLYLFPLRMEICKNTHFSLSRNFPFSKISLCLVDGVFFRQVKCNYLLITYQYINN